MHREACPAAGAGLAGVQSGGKATLLGTRMQLSASEPSHAESHRSGTHQAAQHGGCGGCAFPESPGSWQLSKLELSARLGAAHERAAELAWRLGAAESRLACSRRRARPHRIR